MRCTHSLFVGSRITPSDGSPPRESTDIALVLDPPLPDQPAGAKTAIVSFLTDLDERVPCSKPGRGWPFVSASLIRAQENDAVKIYPRP